MNKKIAFYDAKPWEKSLILQSLNEEELMFCDDSVCEATAKNKETIEIISCFINSNLTKEILGMFPNLKYITTRSTGFDHIDLEYCKSRGIKVSNVPNYGKHTVAEHALTLLLSVVKRIPESLQRVSTGSFNPEHLTGVDVFGKTMGILGTGNIGASMIRMSLGMGMKVIAYDIKPSQELSTSLGFTYMSLEEVLSQSHFVTIHLPYLKSTHHLINDESIKKMKKGVVIINTARGAIIDTRALLQNLRNGYIGGAGLDVLENEKDIDDELSLLVGGGELSLNEAELIIQNNVLIKMPNVVVTPHNAFNTAEALNRITAQTIQNIKAFQSNSPINLVN